MGYSLGWNNPLILTFDPNFQPDIQVGAIFLKAQDPDNPYYDFTVVEIAYCSGDAFAGTATHFWIMPASLDSKACLEKLSFLKKMEIRKGRESFFWKCSFCLCFMFFSRWW